MVKTLLCATGCNVVAIPLAAEEFHKAGPVLSRATGVMIMSISTVIVAINARLSGRVHKHLGGEKE